MATYGSGYFCEECRTRFRVVDTRYYYDEIYRLRKCPKCGVIMYTVEFPIEETPKFIKCWNEADKERTV